MARGQGRRIPISPKHGLNPSMGVCYFCGEPDGTIALTGRLKGDVKAPRCAVWTKEPCAKCQEHMRTGIILIGVEAARRGEEPERTGHFFVVSEDFITLNIKPEELKNTIITKRVAFVDREFAEKLKAEFDKLQGENNSSKNAG